MAEIINLGIVGIKNMGVYDANTAYEKLNVVSYQGSTYCALRETEGNLPIDTDYWQLYAQKGEKGDVGDTGPKPIKGVDYFTDEDKAEIEEDLADDISEAVSESVGSLTSAAPLVASTISEMVDTTRIYVLTTDGHWYWYDGDSWEDGGVYQASENSTDLNDVINYVDGDKVNTLHNTLDLDQLTQNGGGKFLFNKIFKKGFISKIRFRAHSTLTQPQNGILYFYKKETNSYSLIDTIPFVANEIDNYIEYNKFIETDFYIGCDIPYYIAYKSTVFTEPYNVSNVTSFSDIISESALNFNHYYEFGIDVHYSVADKINYLSRLIDVNKEKKYVFLGDSYSVGWTPDGNVKSWCEFCKDFLDLDSQHYITAGSGGASFGNQNNNSFTDLVNTLPNDSSVTDVICCGGYNEIGMTTVNTLAGMQSFKNACATKYPNAKVHVGFIANTTDKTQKANIAGRCGTYINGCSLYNMEYLNNVEYSLHRYYEDFSSDGIHPNATGEEHIAYYVTQALRTGAADVIVNNTVITTGTTYFQSNVRNEITSLLHIANNTYNFTSETLPPFSLTGGNAIDLFTITDGNINGSGIYTSRGIIPNLQITFSDNTYAVINCPFEIVDNKFKLYPAIINSSGTNYVNKQIKTIFIRPFISTFSTLDV